MKKICFLLCFIGVGFFAKAQTNPFPTTDSLERFINRWIRNSAVEAFQNLRLNTAMIGMLRFVQNSEIGSGVDTMYKLNDSTVRLITHAPDTFDVTLRFAGGGSGGPNSNVGPGFRWAVVNTQNIKTFVPGYGLAADSVTNANAITARADTLSLVSWPRLYKVVDSTNRTTIVRKPIIAYLGNSPGIPDTLDVDYGYGLVREPDSTLIVDSFSVASRARLYKVADSLIGLMATAGVANTNLGSHFRWLVPSSQGIKGAANSSTITWDSTSNANSLTAKVDTSAAGIPTMWNVNNGGKTYPDEKPLGVIYEKSQWSDISGDLLPNPSGSNTLTISTGYLNSSAAAFSYNNYVRILPGRPTNMSRWKMTVRFRNTAWSANSFEFGVGIYSAVTHSGAAFGYIAFLQTTSSGSGNLFIYDQSGAVQRATGSGAVTYALNDDIELTYTYNDTTLVFTAQNITTGGTLRTATYTFPANMSVILPNSGNWGLFEGNGGTGTHQVRYIKIESLETQYPNLLIIGNSKTKGYYADFYNLRFSSQLNATYPTTVWNAGSAERLTDMITRLDEFTQLNPSQVILADAASNQLRAGTTITETARLYDILVQAFEAGGTPVYHFVLPEDSTGGGGGLGQTAWNAYLISKYGARVITQVYDDMSTNNVADAGMINADDVHLSQAGHNQVVASVISSGKITTISPNRRTPYRTHDDVVKFTGDSLHFKWKVRSRNNFVPRWSTNLDELTVGPMYMDSLDVIVSDETRPTKPLSTMKMSVRGPIASYGATSSFFFFDRTTTSNYWSTYSDNNTFRLNYTGTDRAYMGTDGRFRIGNAPGVTSSTIVGMLQIKSNQTLSAVPGVLGVNLNIDSSTITMPSSGAAFFTSNSFGRTTLTSAAAGNATVATNVFIDTLTAGTNFSFLGNPRSLTLLGRLAVGKHDSVGTPTGGFIFRDFATGEYRVTQSPSGGGGITSINSETGPSITFAGSNGLTVATTTNTVTYTLGGALTGGTNITGGGSFPLNLGTSGSKISNFAINSADDVNLNADDRIGLNGGVQHKVNLATDADFTATTNMHTIWLGTITANRTLTLPSIQPGMILIIHNENSAGFAWNITGTLHDKTNATVSSLANDSVYTIQGIDNGTTTYWKIVSLY